jgi:hypothetical protein
VTRSELAQRACATWSFLLLASLPAARAARAQLRTPSPFPEYRVDAIVGSRTALQAGAGVVIPLGIYVRLGLDGAAGATWRQGDVNASGRVDAIGRFLFDPLREVPVGVSLGGGVSLPYAVHDPRVRPYLTAVLDVEGRMRGAVTPALELGLGGGARIGLVFRASPARWR